MILSLEHRWIFVATTKTASTTIEDLFAPHVEVCLFSDPQMKHMSITQIRRRFRPFFRVPRYAYEKFFTFAVMREPLSWVTSWFNYLSRPELESRAGKQARYAGDVDFSAFCRAMALDSPPAYARLGKQSARFRENGQLAVDAVVDHARLPEAFAALAPRLGVDISADLQSERRNVSRNVRVTTASIGAEERRFLQDRYAADMRLYENVASADRGVLWVNRTGDLG